jgi:ABC-type antimicrobial peptide transport system permease subunit
VAGVACVCGLALSIAFTRALSGMLYGVSPSDPLTLSGVIAIVLAVAALAAVVPATRAALVEPMRTLREEQPRPPVPPSRGSPRNCRVEFSGSRRGR